jgi:hypothetical protein
MKKLILLACLGCLAGCREKIAVGERVVCTVNGLCGTGTVVSIDIVFCEGKPFDHYKVNFGADTFGSDNEVSFHPKWVKRLKDTGTTREAVASAISFDVSKKTIRQISKQLPHYSIEEGLSLLKESAGTTSLSFFLLTTTADQLKDYQCHINPDTLLLYQRLQNGKSPILISDITSLRVQRNNFQYEGEFSFNAKNEIHGTCLFSMKEAGRGFIVTRLAIAHNDLPGIDNGLLVFNIGE